MKKKIRNYFFTLFVGTILLTGCSTEQEIVDPDNGGTTKGKITFAFPMSKGTTTYVDATGDESLFTTNDMIIYMVNASDSIESIFSGTALNGSGSGSVQTASVFISKEATSAKTFYFVANTSSVPSLSSIVEGNTLSDLLRVTTEVQAATGHLSSSGGLLLTGSVTVQPENLASSETPISVTLKRRVARFDVLNDAATSRVTIREIVLSDTNTSALIFSDKDSLPEDKSNLPTIDFASLSGANAGTCLNVFYLYPTKTASIQLLAEIGGMTRLYNIPLPTGGIQANKSYTLKANNGPQMPVFELMIEDWTGEEITATSGSPVEIISSSVTGNAEGWDENLLRCGATIRGATINLTVASLTPLGVNLEVQDVPESYTITTSKDAVAATPTYGGIGYRQNLTIEIPKYEDKTSMVAKVLIKDAYSPSHSKTITVIGGDYFPTAHKGWAGCNIYYDTAKGHLTFDDVGVTTHQKYQGVFFQWGSLWGVSPAGDFDATDAPTGTILYPPAGGTTTAYTAGLAWGSIPRIPSEVLNPEIEDMRRDWGYTHQVTDSLAGVGDICRWLTYKGYAPAGKSWRLPVSREFGESSTAHSFGAFINGTNEAAVAEGTNSIISGRFKTDVIPNVFFPATGYRSSSGVLLGFETSGYFWTSTAISSNGYNLYFNSNSSVDPENKGGRGTGRTVRCVVE